MSKIRVLVADDHAVLRAGLRLLINTQRDLEVVGETGDFMATRDAVSQLEPDVATIDLSMPGGNGIRLVEWLSRESPRTRLLVLSMHDDPAYVRMSLAAGAAGYVMKKSADTELLEAIRTVAHGRTYLPRLPEDGASVHRSAAGISGSAASGTTSGTSAGLAAGSTASAVTNATVSGATTANTAAYGTANGTANAAVSESADRRSDGMVGGGRGQSGRFGGAGVPSRMHDGAGSPPAHGAFDRPGPMSDAASTPTSASLSQRDSARNSFADLSERERQVLLLVARGHTNQAIANQLFLSVKTIESYRARLMSKLGLRNRAELTQFAMYVEPQAVRDEMPNGGGQ